MLSLIGTTAVRALVPTVFAINPTVILAIGVAGILYSVARAIDKSGGIEEIEMGFNNFKAKFAKA